MRRLLPLLLPALLAAAAWRSAPAADEVDEGKIRVLVITGGHSYEQQPFNDLFDSIPDITVTRAEYPNAAERLQPDLARKCDVIVFYDMWKQGISPQQQKAFVQLLQEGIGVVALHHTLAAHQDWPEYAKIIGGKYQLKERRVNGKVLPPSGFEHGQDMHVAIADPNHPITRGLQDFDIHDEAYNHYDTNPGVHVLLTTDHPKNDPELAWVTHYGRSRVFYLMLGHDHFAYENPNYRTLVARGVRWAAGRPAEADAPYTPLFNGKNLDGWVAEGNARWEVQDGLLVGRQGEGNSPGDLLTEASYDDFELKTTLKVVWPANTGVWYRYQSNRQAYQADVLEYKEPFALTGSLYCTGKMFLAINDNPQLVNRDGWNTIIIRAAGDRHVIFLNGVKTADVRDGTSDHGRIGFQVHPGDQFANMKVIVREVMIRPL